ncbi:YktB family protein [Halobacillus naozhouensis]|uniref:UPF0637 protein P9989_09660 n=1 Tax=Halobacillus naozhouensis TaxID=554880 RepID=A0ABY8J2J8_9BACI|nr:DUF1054 domain-containing protein [Halobacillus naozhouensis]WFT76600.1 DUF1054 domain-containing protein [Halobacillus naozhouensis]
MSDFTGFSQKDFDVFSIPGLEERMEELRERISPKLDAIATELAPDVTAMTGDEMFVHVAKHARRTTNPPNDTWAALASNKRGYKKLPHFQIGMWESHVFIWFAVIYENPVKEAFGETLLQHKKEIKNIIPDHFVWSTDHTKPDAFVQGEMSDEKFAAMFTRLTEVKKAEILCGIHLSQDDDQLTDPDAFIHLCRDTFQTLEPLYRYAKHSN